MNTNKEFVLTKEGLEKLNAEYRNLIDVERPAVIEALQNARAMGDLSENADYDAARNKQAEIEGRIKEIEHILANVKMVDENKKSKTIQLSSVVTYLDMDLDKEFTVRIVSGIETDPVSDAKNLKISNDCPLGAALLGHKVGDVVTVKVNAPYEVKIISFK